MLKWPGLIFLFISLNISAQTLCFNDSVFVPHLIQTDSGNIFAPDFDMYLTTLKGCRPPSFDVTSISGRKISLDKMKGKVVVLNFWFTQCAACIREFKSLNRLVDEYKDKGVEFVAFALDKKEAINSFLVKNPLQYDIVAEANAMTDSFHIQVFPINIVLDKEHRVVKILHANRAKTNSEFEAYEQIKAFIEEALKQKK